MINGRYYHVRWRSKPAIAKYHQQGNYLKVYNTGIILKPGDDGLEVMEEASEPVSEEYK